MKVKKLGAREHHQDERTYVRAHAVLEMLLDEFDIDTPGVKSGFMCVAAVEKYGIKIDFYTARSLVLLEIAHTLLAMESTPVRPPINPTATTTADYVVYFIQSGAMVKIGYTSNLGDRLKGLAQRPEAVLHTEPGGRRRESALHRKFAHLRDGRTEWFQLTDEVRDYISKAAS